jgi:hypothetical protein
VGFPTTTINEVRKRRSFDWVGCRKQFAADAIGVVVKLMMRTDVHVEGRSTGRSSFFFATDVLVVKLIVFSFGPEKIKSLFGNDSRWCRPTMIGGESSIHDEMTVVE